MRQWGTRSNSPTRCTSGSRSTEKRSATRSWTVRIGSTTSAARAPADVTMKFACFRETVAPPTAVPFRPASSTSRAEWSPGVLEDAAAVRLRERLVPPPPLADLVHPRADRLALVRREPPQASGRRCGGRERRRAVREARLLCLHGDGSRDRHVVQVDRLEQRRELAPCAPAFILTDLRTRRDAQRPPDRSARA